MGRRTLKEVALSLNTSVPTLQKNFDNIFQKENFTFNKKFLTDTASPSVNLIIDATFFGREYGFLCFYNSDTNKIIYYKEIETENTHILNQSLNILVKMGYKFKSFTLDGKRGFINLLKQRFPRIPIQMCQFHQKQIIRRYTTNNPQTKCGIDLKELMKKMSDLDYVEFEYKLLLLNAKYKYFLKERNENNGFKHRRLRSAFRSLKTNLPYLFTCKKYPDLNIPNTSNKLEGFFSHLKEKIKIHRGLSEKRKKQAIEFFLYTKS